MTYIELINSFWTSHETHSFRTNEIALFFYLLKINNQLSWSEYFERNNRKVMADLDISFNTLKVTRNKLKQAGLIDFETKNGSSKTRYTFSKFDKVTNKVTNEVANEVANEVIDELNKTKIKTNTPPYIPPTSEKQKKDFDLSFVEAEFLPVFKTWLEYKQARRQSYKTQKSLELCYNEILKLSGKNVSVAQEIVNQSIARNYAGLFELKTSRNEQRKPFTNDTLRAVVTAGFAMHEADANKAY